MASTRNGDHSDELYTINCLEQIGDSMSEKLLANSDIVNCITTSMKSDVICSKSEDFDSFEPEEPDDLHEFFETDSVLVATEHKLTPCCASCGKHMDLVEGDIIYGEDWYHDICWKAIRLQTR